ncbi:Uncharacterised protein [Mycobacteroides abscessus subsp. massiliense]|nr:Uncharacterised protein [Mycobacteroides abscessus subsp. massiliense]
MTGVGKLNISLTGKRIPVFFSMALMAAVAFNECPPSSKKLSSMPTGDIPRISSNTSTIACSVLLLGGTYFELSNISGSGNLLLSSFPFMVSGNSSICIIKAGIIYSVTSSLIASLIWGILSSCPFSAMRYAQRISSFPTSFTITTASAILLCFLNTLSISPNSIL